jgi:uncharacterized protein YgiM (DUF1202 family)
MKRNAALLILLLTLASLACSFSVFGKAISIARPMASGTQQVPSPTLPLASSKTPTLPAPQSIYLVCNGEHLNVRAKTGLRAAVVGTLENGVPVIVLTAETKRAEDGGEWVRIKTLSGQVSGWVNVRYVCLKQE